MGWRQSLIRLSTYEVEMLQKRLSEVVERRWAIEVRIAALEAEAEAEIAHARANAEAGFYLVGFKEGVRLRRVARGAAGPGRHLAAGRSLGDRLRYHHRRADLGDARGAARPGPG